MGAADAPVGSSEVSLFVDAYQPFGDNKTILDDAEASEPPSIGQWVSSLQSRLSFLHRGVGIAAPTERAGHSESIDYHFDAAACLVEGYFR